MAVLIVDVPEWNSSAISVKLELSDYSKIRIFRESDEAFLVGPESPSPYTMSYQNFSSGTQRFLVEGKELGSTQIKLIICSAGSEVEICSDEVYVTGTDDLRDLGMHHLFQFKDTAMICTNCSHVTINTPDHRWNAAHPGYYYYCGHCSSYCGPTSLKIVGDYYGGSISRDEIYYQFKPSFMHDGFSASQVQNGLAFVLGIDSSSIMSLCGSAGWRKYMNVLVSYRPMVSTIDSPRHAQVICGFTGNKSASSFKVRILCPSSGYYEASFEEYTETTQLLCEFPPDQPLSGTVGDVEINGDSDTDGVVDFDEKYRFSGQPFNLLWNHSDSNSNGTNDMEELYHILWP